MSDFQVSILKRDGTQSSFYPTYTLAVAETDDYDVIQIWADLNEKIVLKDKVDIWIMPGVVVDNRTTDISTKGPTITDNNIAVNCNIYGMGVIKNTYSATDTRYECIKILNSNTSLSIECDYIEGIGAFSITTSPDVITFTGFSIKVENALKFHLTCRKVISKKSVAIWIGTASIVNDVNLKINSIETGLVEDNNTGSSALIISGIGSIKINEILCRNAGHCLSVRGGNITAKVEKMTSVMNYTTITLSIATVHMDQSTSGGTQKLILYFDEILSLHGETNSAIGIHHHEGTGIFIGRKVYSKEGNAIDISGDNTKGSIICNEIISDFLSGVRIDKANNQFMINANFIKGYSYYGCIYAQSDANLLLKNAKLINTDTSTNSRCIVLEKNTTLNQIPVITINNVKAVTGNISGGSIFYQANFSGINIFNFGLFANKGLDANVSLKIGVGTNPMDPGYNYQCIIDPLLT